MIMGEFNVYAMGKNGLKLRAVSIGPGGSRENKEHWRIAGWMTKKRSKILAWWWLDDIEYDTAAEAMYKYIEMD
jgi:hypothetical protein